MGKSKKKRGQVKESSSQISEPNNHHFESKIRFSMSKCSIGDDYCLLNVKKKDLKSLYKRLGRFENLTWGQLKNLKRESSITKDDKDTIAYNIMSQKFQGCSYYGHFRVANEDKTPFRVFVGMLNDMLYILLIDIKGNIHHK